MSRPGPDHHRPAGRLPLMTPAASMADHGGVDFPMFPLGGVLFPGQVLPLHIFESRYQAMLEHCLAGNREFAVVLIERGHEVGGGDVRSRIGTVARILQAVQVTEGHWAVITVGVRRILVQRWLADDPWPRAEVGELPDPDPDADFEEWPALLARFRRVAALAAEMGVGPAELGQQIAEDPAQGSFQVAALSPLGSFDQQKILAAGSVSDRLTRLGAALGEVEADLRAELALGD